MTPEQTIAAFLVWCRRRNIELVQQVRQYSFSADSGVSTRESSRREPLRPWQERDLIERFCAGAELAAEPAATEAAG